MIYRACIYFHEFLEVGGLNPRLVLLTHNGATQDEGLKSDCLVLYSSDPKCKANATLPMALYVVCTIIVLPQLPWTNLVCSTCSLSSIAARHGKPSAQLEFMPFRDAGRGRSDSTQAFMTASGAFGKPSDTTSPANHTADWFDIQGTDVSAFSYNNSTLTNVS
jgi:hypothetical protein